MESLQKQVEKLVNANLKLEEKMGKLQDEQLIFTTQQKVSYAYKLRTLVKVKIRGIGRPEQCLENIVFRKQDVFQYSIKCVLLHVYLQIESHKLECVELEKLLQQVKTNL